MSVRTGHVSQRNEPVMRAKMTTAAVMLLARWTPYLEDELLGLARLVTPGSVCVDVGSAAGLYTLALSRLVGPSGKVHSVEPLSFARPVWTRVLGARESSNVRHHSLALGAEPGSGVMSVPVGRYGPVTGRSFLTGRSHGLGSNAEFPEHISVNVTVDTLDHLAESMNLTRLDFVKIDVEGAELHILAGGQRAIEAFKPMVLIELEARHTERYRYSPEDVVSWFREHGYGMYAWRNGWQQADAVHEDTRNYLFRVPGVPAPRQS